MYTNMIYNTYTVKNREKTTTKLIEARHGLHPEQTVFDRVDTILSLDHLRCTQTLIYHIIHIAMMCSVYYMFIVVCLSVCPERSRVRLMRGNIIAKSTPQMFG